MDNDRAAQARAVFAHLRKGASRMTSIPQHITTDSIPPSKAPSTSPRSESGRDGLKSTDGTTDSEIDMERVDSVTSRRAPARGQTRVYESGVAITPRASCVHLHRNGKHVASNVPTCHYTDCYESHFDPSDAKPTPYRMTTSNQLEDLKRWLTTPNARHETGKRVDRQKEVQFVDTCTTENLRASLTYGIEKVKEIRFEVHSLAAYFEERYGLYFRDLMRDAIHVSQLPMTPEVATMRRQDLVYQLVLMATQIDYLREEIERLNREIVKTKWAHAQKGSDFEIRELIRLGYIELEEETKKDERMLRLG